MDSKGIQDKCTGKRKRLDARTFRQWHIEQGKKHKSPLVRDTASERRDKLDGSSGNLEANCLREGEYSSETLHSDSEQKRIDSEVKSLPSQTKNGEAAVEEGCEQASSTNVHLHEITLGGAIANGNLCSEEVSVVNHQKILSHAEPGSDGTDKDERDVSHCKPSSSRFIEYWVPVGLSHLQLEKCCEILIENSLILCSSAKKDVVDGLHDVLTTMRKCCDHPYLVDQSLEKFVNQGRPTVDYLRTGIEASGKLLLLDKILEEARDKQLRVLVVFQSKHSKSHSIHLPHILDDFVRQRFGEDSYVHIYKEFDQTRKRAALDSFNDKENGKFVILIEKSSCHPSIKLSSVDFVILFNSEWSPINDMRSLRKMLIQSRLEHLNVFRLYSSNSVEEKVLILAKDGTPLDVNIHTFSHHISHVLLLWGTSFMFDKLNDFHSQCSSIASLNSLSDHKLVNEVVHELSALLCGQHSNKISCSLISRVSEANKEYSANMSLRGETDMSFREDDIPHNAIWVSLFEGKNPLWRLLPGSSKRLRKRSEFCDSLSHYSQCDTEVPSAMGKRASNSRSESPSRKTCLPSSGGKAGKVASHPNSGSNEVELFPCGNYNGSTVEENCNRRMKELILKQKREIREFCRTKRDKREILEEEHRLELDLISQRYAEAELKQEELQKLDHVFKEKVEELNRQMDIKRKELDDIQLASRMKEKHMKDRLFALLTTKNAECSTSSLVNAPLLGSEFESQAFGVVKNPLYPSAEISDTVQQSESQQTERVELGSTKGSTQHSDPPDQMLTETVVLSVGSDGDDVVSVPRVAVFGTADLNNLVAPENRASHASSPCDRQPVLQHTSNTEIGGGFTDMGASKETSPGLTGVSRSLESDGENDVPIDKSILCTINESQMLSGQNDTEMLANIPSREMQDGNDIVEAPVAASNRVPKSRGADLESTSIMGGQQSRESVTDMTSSVLAQSTCVLVLPKTSNGIPESRGADLETTSTMGGQQSRENVAGMTSSVLARSTCVLVRPKTCTTPVNSSPFHEGLRDNTQPHSNVGTCLNICSMGSISRSLVENNLGVWASGQAPNISIEPLNNVSNLWTSNEPQQCSLSRHRCPEPFATLPNREVYGDASAMQQSAGERDGETEGRHATDWPNSSTVAGQQGIGNVTDFPPSSLAVSSYISLQPQTCTVWGNSSALEQPMISTNLPCNQMRQTAGTLAVQDCQTPPIRALCQSAQIRAPLGNLGSCDLPVMQPTAVVSLPFQSTGHQAQPCNPTLGGTTMTQPTNSYFQESSSLRHNVLPLSDRDPLQYELVRLRKEEEEVVQFYEDKVMQLKCAREKEFEEVHRKYDLTLREAGNELLLRKEELQSRLSKVSANLLLAQTWKENFQKRAPSAMSHEALLTALLQLSTPQHHMTEQRFLPTAELTPPPVQVVNELSELMSFNPVRQHTSSSLNTFRNPPVGPSYHSQPPPLLGPVTSTLRLNASALFSGMPNQQQPTRQMLVRPHGLLRGSYHLCQGSGVQVNLNGTAENPVTL